MQVEPDPAEMAARCGRRNARARLARAAAPFPLRQPAGRYGRERYRAASAMRGLFTYGSGRTVRS